MSESLEAGGHGSGVEVLESLFVLRQGKLDLDKPLAQYKVKPAAYWGDSYALVCLPRRDFEIFLSDQGCIVGVSFGVAVLFTGTSVSLMLQSAMCLFTHRTWDQSE